jgi:hypothetical protein
MKPPYFTFLALLTLTLLSCGGEKQQPSVALPVPEPEKVIEDNTLFISTFDTIPDEISGCGCSFASDSLAYKLNHLLFADDIGEIAYMKINGKITRLTQSKDATEENVSIATDSTATHAVYKGNGIEVILDSRKGRDIDYEVWEETGTITVKQDDGQTITKSIYGACGC